MPADDSQEGGDQLCLADRMEVASKADTDFDWKRPAFFPQADEEGVGQQLQSLPEHIGETRIQEREAECCQQMAKSGADFKFRRLEPKGQPTDSVELLEWVPEFLTARKMHPENLRGLGAPHLLVSKPGSCRFGSDEWPMTGLGQLLCVTKGEVTLCVWPGTSTTLRGALLADQWRVLFYELSASSFKEWADQELHYCLLPRHTAAWIPYGWFGAIIARPSEYAVASCISLPYVSHQMASECPDWGAVSKFLIEDIEHFKTKGPKVWASIGDTAIEWLRNTAASPTPPSKPIPIADRISTATDGQPPAAVEKSGGGEKEDPADEHVASAASNVQEASDKGSEKTHEEAEAAVSKPALG